MTVRSSGEDPRELRLSHQDYVISFEFTLLDHRTLRNIQSIYKLTQASSAETVSDNKSNESRIVMTNDRSIVCQHRGRPSKLTVTIPRSNRASSHNSMSPTRHSSSLAKKSSPQTSPTKPTPLSLSAQMQPEHGLELPNPRPVYSLRQSSGHIFIPLSLVSGKSLATKDSSLAISIQRSLRIIRNLKFITAILAM